MLATKLQEAARFEGLEQFPLLEDWADPKFIAHVLAKLPAPRDPVHGKPLWEGGMKLHGVQRDVVFERYRFKKIDGGVRGGKSMVAAVCLLVDILWRETVTGVMDDLWCVCADTYAMAQEEMRHLARMLEELGVPFSITTPENNRWRITFPHKRAEVHTMTAGDVTKIASRPYRGFVVAEAAQTVVDTWHQARARVAQTRGWVLLEGTFEQRKGPWYGLMTEEWQRKGPGVVYTMPSWSNPIAFPGGRNDPEILLAERDSPPSVFRERYAGLPQKQSGLIFTEAEQRYIVRRRFPALGGSYDPERPVYLAIDPGVAHAYAVLACQFYPSPEVRKQLGPKAPGNVCHVIDAVYRWGHDTRQMVEECARRPWAKQVSEAVLDFASRQRRAEGERVIEQWAKQWRELTKQGLWCRAERVPLRLGYDTHKRALLNAWPEAEAQREFNFDGRLGQVVYPDGPRLYIDPDAAAPFFGGVVDGRMFAGEYNLHVYRETRDGVVLNDEPVDTFNDAIKALNYLLFWWFGAGGKRQVERMTSAADFALRAG